ncbi:MAG TPA: phage tail tape measure protein, partial [Acidimicrobiales bacterium]|nr:phage tail tape measure protein [Acidimicrobiales bacterium]
MPDRTLRALITGDNTGAVAAMEGTAVASTAAADEMDSKFNSATSNVGGYLSRIGSSMQNAGIPFGSALTNMGAKLDEASTHGNGLMTAMNELGKVTLLAGVAGFAAAGVASVKMASDFQSAMTQLVTGAGESQKNIAMVSQGILAMAGAVGQTPEDLAKGMFLIESAGYHGAAGLTVLKSAAEGAATGGAQMDTVADALTTAMHDYSIPTDRANAVTSALVETVASGKTHLEDLASSLGKVMPQAAALGITFQDVTGAMATMTNAGLSARLASMHLSNTLLALSAPAATASTAMTSVGLTSQQVKNTMDGPGGLSAALELIEEHVSSKFPAGSVAAVNAFKAIMGGATGYSTALMLTGANSKTFEDNVKSIGSVLDGSSKSVQGFSKTQGDLKFQMAQAKATLDSLAIEFGDVLIPKLEDAGKAVESVVEWFMQHKVAAEALAITIGTVLAGAVAVFAVNTVTSMIQSVQRALTSIGLLSSATEEEASVTDQLSAQLDAQNAVLAQTSAYFSDVAASQKLSATVAMQLEASETTLNEGQVVLSDTTQLLASNMTLLNETATTLDGTLSASAGTDAEAAAGLTSVGNAAEIAGAKMTTAGDAAATSAGEMKGVGAAAATTAGEEEAAGSAATGFATSLGGMATAAGIATLAGIELGKVIGATDQVIKTGMGQTQASKSVQDAWNAATQQS